MTSQLSTLPRNRVNGVMVRREYHEVVVQRGMFEGIDLDCQLCQRPITVGFLIYALPVGPFEAETYHNYCFHQAVYGERVNRFFACARSRSVERLLAGAERSDGGT